jgi:iron complex transport system permease protein
MSTVRTTAAPALVPEASGREVVPPDLGPRRLGPRRVVGVVVLLGGLFLAVMASLAIGSKPIPAAAVLDAVWSFDPANTDHLIVRDLRLPRTLVGVAVGASLAVAGALMQGITRNPLADPGLLGVNAGAAFAVALSIWAFDLADLSTQVWFAFIGAGVVSIVVYALGSMGRGGATPVRLALAGAALSALLGSFTATFLLLDASTLERFRYWDVGALAGRDAEIARQLAPFVAVGLLVAFAIARPMNALGLGEDAARALGTRVGVTRLMAAIAVMLLCGSAVAAAGPIIFVGLVVPHVARVIFGPDQRWLLPACALGGAAFLLACDIAGRIVARPGEVQVGIMTAIIGGPAFVFLVRRTRMAQL